MAYPGSHIYFIITGAKVQTENARGKDGLEGRDGGRHDSALRELFLLFPGTEPLFTSQVPLQ